MNLSSMKGAADSVSGDVHEGPMSDGGARSIGFSWAGRIGVSLLLGELLLQHFRISQA